MSHRNPFSPVAVSWQKLPSVRDRYSQPTECALGCPMRHSSAALTRGRFAQSGCPRRGSTSASELSARPDGASEPGCASFDYWPARTRLRRLRPRCSPLGVAGSRRRHRGWYAVQRQLRRSPIRVTRPGWAWAREHVQRLPAVRRGHPARAIHDGDGPAPALVRRAGHPGSRAARGSRRGTSAPPRAGGTITTSPSTPRPARSSTRSETIGRRPRSPEPPCRRARATATRRW
jgi:hypothetical protein